MITDEQVENAVKVFRECEHTHDVDAMREAVEAYEQSKWVKFDVNDGRTYPPKEEDVLLDIGHGLITGWLCIEENPYNSTPDDRYDIFFVCLDGGYVIDEIGHVSKWQPLPTRKE